MGKYLILYSCLFLSFNSVLFGQESKRDLFIGINPSFTVEPFYEEGEFDVNVVPIVFQKAFGLRTSIRLTSIVGYGFRKTGDKINSYGFETAVPIFFKKKEDPSHISKGFFLAPLISLVRYTVEDHTNVGLWLEPGFQIPMKKNFSMSFGLQVGTTYFIYPHTENSFKEHIGIKFVFGKWF